MVLGVNYTGMKCNFTAGYFCRGFGAPFSVR